MAERLIVMDRVSVFDRTNFYAPGEIGKTRRLTPEGFMVCEGVAIARTGEQRYHKSELPLDPDTAGEITVNRPPEEVFSANTIASFEGKPVTVEHPNEFVTPGSWKTHAVGTVQNVRQGKGIEDDMLIADLLITDGEAIAYVNRKRPELSCGYDAEYEQTMLGHAIQRNIIGNHVALVDRGRAGSRCAIRDSDATEEFFRRLSSAAKSRIHLPLGDFFMKSRFADKFIRVMQAFHQKDADALDRELATDIRTRDDDEEEGTMDRRIKDALDWIDEQRKAVKDAAEAKKKKDEEDCDAKKKSEDAQKAKDTAAALEAAKVRDVGVIGTGDAAQVFKHVYARAEILCPGIAVPTGDSAAQKDALPALMLKAVRSAYETEAGKAVIEPFLLGEKIDAVTVDNVSGVFTGAAELMRKRNNDDSRNAKLTVKDFGKPTTTQALAERNREFWNKRLA
jgi:uncharacterized protein